MCAWHASMHGAAFIRLYQSMECRPASGAHASADSKRQCYACNSLYVINGNRQFGNKVCLFLKLVTLAYTDTTGSDTTFLWWNKILYIVRGCKSSQEWHHSLRTKRKGLSLAAVQLGEWHPSKLACPTPLIGMACIKFANGR